MNDIRKILARRARAPIPGVLATVVKVQGSAYRRPGARMLIEENGETTGLVSGGCLDADLLERARAVLQSRQPTVFSYDSSSDPEGLWGLQLGCPGRVHVLLEPVDSPGCANLLSFWAQCMEQSGNGIVATVIGTESATIASIGERLIMNEQGIVKNEIADELLSKRIQRDAVANPRNSHAMLRRYEHADSAVEVLFETISPPISLFLFGGGPDAVPLARFASELGWDVTVVDHRPALTNQMRFPSAMTVLVERESMPPAFSPTPQTVAVIMTHNFSQDVFYLKHLLFSSVRYVGLLGPTSKSTLLLRKLKDDGFHLTREHLQRLFTPVGLDIGSETPEEIALAILAEIQAVLNNRAGGFLRERKAPIH